MDWGGGLSYVHDRDGENAAIMGHPERVDYRLTMCMGSRACQ